MLAGASVAASGAVTGAITTNIFLSIVLGVSIKKLWMLISTLQIIVHFPMLGISLPSNVLLCFSMIIEVSNLNIIPKKYIKQLIGAFVKD